MTRLEAIAILDGFKYNPLLNEQHYEALDMAVSALSENKGEWIPVTDPKKELPKDKMLWVSTVYGFVDCVYWDMTEWSQCVDDVIAYIPYFEPEPYKAESEDKE